MHEQHERRYKGGADRLRSAERLARLEVDKVVGLCIEGLAAARVLDVGSGTGVFAEAFLSRGCAVVGVDPNVELLAEARRLVPKAEFYEGTAENLPSGTGEFDLVFLGNVLHEADDGVAALKEARRATRHRVAVLEFPYIEEEQGPPLAHRLRPEEISAMSQRAGFTGISRVVLRHLELYLLAP